MVYDLRYEITIRILTDLGLINEADDILRSSPRMHPTAHISIAVVCVFEPNKISGARYHKVTTLGVKFLLGIPKVRARPKSAEKKTILLDYTS